MAVVDLMAIAFATGIGAGIGNPLGNWIYKKFVEKRLDSAGKYGTKDYYDKKFQEVADNIKRLEITEEKLAKFLSIEQKK